jgi:hypothetical protein
MAVVGTYSVNLTMQWVYMSIDEAMNKAREAANKMRLAHDDEIAGPAYELLEAFEILSVWFGNVECERIKACAYIRATAAFWRNEAEVLNRGPCRNSTAVIICEERAHLCEGLAVDIESGLDPLVHAFAAPQRGA